MPDFSGAQFSLLATNSLGASNSPSAVLTVLNPFNSAFTSNIWTLLPGARSYTSIGAYLERGMAYNPVSGNLIIATRNIGDFVVAINGQTDQEMNYLDTTGVAGGTFDINMVGASDDGAIYVGNLTTAATTSPYILYRWPDDSGVGATVAFSGDPGGSSFPGLRWGDSIAVRGSGPTTQVLLAPGFATNNIVSLLQTTDGTHFQAFPIQFDTPSTHTTPEGLTFGPGTNTFYLKIVGALLILVQFDATSGTGFVQHSYSLGAVPGSVTAIGYSPSLKLLAGLDSSAVPQLVSVFSVADSTQDPVIEDQKSFPSSNSNPQYGGLGAVVFGPGYLWVADSNNGIQGFQINTNYPAVTPFSITQLAATEGGLPLLTWQTQPGHMYQALGKNSVTATNWFPVGAAALAGGTTLSVTNYYLPGASAGQRFYHVRGF